MTITSGTNYNVQNSYNDYRCISIEKSCIISKDYNVSDTCHGYRTSHSI